MKVEDMKGGYTTGSCATAGMKAGLLALLDKNIVDQVVIENPQGQYIEVPIKAVEVISDTEAKVTVMKDGGDDPDVTHGNDVETTVTLDNTGELRFRAGFGVCRLCQIPAVESWPEIQRKTLHNSDRRYKPASPARLQPPAR